MAQEYARAIARVVVAQLASNAGYERVQVCKVLPCIIFLALCCGYATAFALGRFSSCALFTLLPTRLMQC